MYSTCLHKKRKWPQTRRAGSESSIRVSITQIMMPLISFTSTSVKLILVIFLEYNPVKNKVFV